MLCAYVTYRSTDDISLYSVEVLGLDEVKAGQIAVMSFWLRPVGALLAGFLADR